MKKDKRSKIQGYYFITDNTLSRKGNLSDVHEALAAGVTIVQYRDKTGSTRKLLKEAGQLRAICKDICFIVNDRIDIALSVQADGVHLGQDDMPYTEARRILGKDRIIGLSVHNVQEALEAQGQGADYIGVGPIFNTQTKADAGRPCGVSLITEIKKVCRLPIVAVGGITPHNAPDVIGAGALAICAISWVVRSNNVKAAIEEFQSEYKR